MGGDAGECMSLRHEHITDLVAAIEARLTALCPSLAAVSRSQATSLKDIAELVPRCHRLPAAVVLLGPVESDQAQSSRGARPRLVDVGVLLVAEYSALEDEGTAAHWAILDEVNDAFLPQTGRGEKVGLPVAVLGEQDGANRGTLLVPSGYRPLPGLQGRCAGVYNLLAVDVVQERTTEYRWYIGGAAPSDVLAVYLGGS